MDAMDMRFIVFLIDTKIKQHDGKILASYPDAKQYVMESMTDHYADKAVIGMFVMDNTKEMLITMVETIGFPGDKKDVNQLKLFEPSKTTA